MENSHKFFNNHNCKYFPCHNQPEEADFNCLFCYCPLYPLGDKCGGDFTYVRNLKTCMGCTFPHHPQNYDEIVSKLRGAKC